jgi:hypothetical protein
MVPSKKLFLQLLLLLSTFRVAVAIPAPLQEGEEVHGNTRSQSPATPKPEGQTRPGGLIWKTVVPYFGAATILALLGGLVYFGTRHEETHNEALEAHKKEAFRGILESGEWEKEPELGESVTSGERRAIAEAGKSDRDKLEKLEKEKEKLDKDIEEKQMDIIIAYHDQVKHVQDKHTKKGG